MNAAFDPMSADVASVDYYDAVTDRNGDIWVRRANHWDYIDSDGALSGWDARDQLPAMYEPYSPLSPAATAFILARLS